MASSGDGQKLVAVIFDPTDTFSAKGIFRSTDSGATWNQALKLDAFWSSVASSSDGQKLVACSRDAYIVTSSDSGITWEQRYTPAERLYWEDVASSSDGEKLVAVVYQRGIYRSSDSGQTWNQTSAPDDIWSAVASSSDGQILVAASSNPGGKIYISTDYGETWDITYAPADPDNIQEITFWTTLASSSDGQQLVAGSLFNGIYRKGSPAPTCLFSCIGNYLAGQFGCFFKFPLDPISLAGCTIEALGTMFTCVVTSLLSFRIFCL